MMTMARGRHDVCVPPPGVSNNQATYSLRQSGQHKKQDLQATQGRRAITVGRGACRVARVRSMIVMRSAWRTRASITRSLPSLHARLLSTSALGTLYESHCLRSLEALLPGRLALQRIGGRGDRGVDLTGWWYVPPRQEDDGAGQHEDGNGTTATGTTVVPQRVRVLVQCKATLSATKKLGPVILREMEGVVGRYRRGGDDVEQEREQQGSSIEARSSPPSSSPALLAVICSSSGFSKATNVQVSALSGVNFLLVHLPLPDEVTAGSAQDGAEQNEGYDSELDSSLASSGDDSGAITAGSQSHPTTILCSPSLTASDSTRNRLGGYFDLRWQRALSGNEHDGDAFKQVEQDDQPEEPGATLKPILSWRHC